MKILHYKTIDSTNKEAIRLIACGEKEGTVILSDIQTDGHGRLGRPWIGFPGNLFASYIIKGKTPRENHELAFLSAITVIDAIKNFSPETKCLCKWPNDIMIADRKVCGILLEAADNDYIVAGIGMNLASHPELQHTSYPSTSILESIHKNISNLDMCESLASYFAKNLEIWRESGFKNIREKWLSYAYRINETVTVKQFDKTYSGIFQTINENGELIILDKVSKQKIKINVGDVSYEKTGKEN